MRAAVATVATVAAVLALGAPAAAHAAPVTCGSGTTIAAFAPRLRIIAVAFHERNPENRGYHEYACAGPHARPLSVGESQGVGAAFQLDTERYVLAGGGRYLAAASVEEDEGGGSTTASVYDLRTRRTITGDFGVDVDEHDRFMLRLGADGHLIDDAFGTLRDIAPGGRSRRLSGAAADAAVAGTTLYWTEAGVARAATLPGPASDAPDSVIDLGIGATGPSRCRARRGTTVARSLNLRVARAGERWFACRVGSLRAAGLPAALRAGSLRIASDRWVFYAAGDSGRVLDMRTRRTVTRVPFTAGRPPLLLDDGTVAWTDAAGTLLAQRPGAAAPETLDAAASALAAAGPTLYWTSGGVPRRR